MIKIICKRKIHAEFVDEILAFYRDVMVPESNRENGCISYELYRDIEDANTLVLIEEWENEECETSHQKTEHYMKLKEILTLNKISSADIHFLRKV